MNNTGFKIDNFSRKLTEVCQKMIDLLLEFRHLSLMLDFLRAFPSLNVGFSRDVFAFYARCGASTCPRPPRKSTLRGREGEERRTGSGSMHFSNSKSPEIDRYVRFLSTKMTYFDVFFSFYYLDFARLNPGCFAWNYRGTLSASHTRQFWGCLWSFIVVFH